MIRKALVLDWIRFVTKHAEHIKAAKNRVGKADVLREGLLWVVPTLHRVSHSNDCATGLQRRDDSSFGNGDCLLLHRLVDRGAVLIVHFVELVDETDAIIGKDHGAALKGVLA